MYSTGSSFFNAFLHVAVYSPVIPLFIIIFRQLYSNYTFNLLMIYCLLSIFFSMICDLAAPESQMIQVIQNMQYFVEFVLLSILLRSAISSSVLKQIVTIILVLFCTMVITSAVLKGYNNYLSFMYGAGNGLLLSSSLLLTFELIGSEKKNLISSYKFWIAAGIFFCYGCNFLLSFGWKFFFDRNSIAAQELLAFNYLALLLKSLFFSASTIVYKRLYYQ